MALKADDMPMEIDHSEFTQERAPATAASTSPGEPVVDADGDVGMNGPHYPEPPTPVFTLTNGQSIGVQFVPVKAADLSPDTTILSVTGDDHVIRTAWRPHDPTIVAAAGDMFCDLWKLSGQRSSVTSTHERLVENKGDRTWVTAMAWDPAGIMLAVATYNDLVGSITMYSAQGTAIDLLPEIPRMVSGLRWAHRGLQMVVVVSDGKNSELALWDQAVRPDDFPPPQMIDGQIYEVAWSGSDQVYACGDGSVYQCGVDASIRVLKTFNSDDRCEPWTFVRASPMAGSSVAIVASPATANLWIPTHDLSIKAAHHGDITAIELRPQPQTLEFEKDARVVLATSSLDDTVKLWHIDLEAKQCRCVHRLFLGSGSPALVSAFSPDGYALAAASRDKLFIWNAERGGSPISAWTVPSVNLKEETNQEGSGGIENPGDSDPYRSLSWDTDGKKLALGSGKQVRIHLT
jgi:WD40 repeat protein